MSARRSSPLALALAEGDDPAAALEAGGHGAAAAEVRAGRALGEVLESHRLLPRAYRATFAAGAGGATRTLIEAADRHTARGQGARKTTRAALLSAAFAWTVMIAASVWAVPVFLAQLVDCGEALPGLVQLGLTVFGVLASPAGMIAAAALFIGLWAGAGALWLRSPAGRRSEDAFAATALAALVEAGVGVPEALRRVAGAVRRSARFVGAGDALEQGTPLHRALRKIDLIQAEDGGLVDRAGDQLGGVLHAIATVREADEAARAPHAGQWIWAIYALTIGGVAAIFAGLIMGGTVAVVQCVG